MPAPPANRQSHDDIESVIEMDRLERARVQLLLKQRELEEENARLRKERPVEVFPPQSVPPFPPPPGTPQIIVSDVSELDFEKLKKQVAKSAWGKRAITFGVCAALALGAFNMTRSAIPIQKAAATQARLEQTEKLTEDQLRARIKQEEQTLAALRASSCYFKQIRGALQRQGLDLTSLPGGGIKVTRIAEDDPNRVGAPRFIVEEKCPDFPQLPREP